MRIGLASQRRLIDNFKLATQLGGELIHVKSDNVAKVIAETAAQKKVTTICMGKPNLSPWQLLFKKNIFTTAPKSSVSRKSVSERIDISVTRILTQKITKSKTSNT